MQHRTKAVSWLVGILLAVQAGLLGWAAARNSPTLDEVGHLPAGLYVWEFGRFDVYRVNPPLVRTLAALPAYILGAETDWSDYRSGPGMRPEWSLGRALIAANGDNWFRYFVYARWAVIPLVLLGGYICFRWACELYGPTGGLLALTLWCFCPNVLTWGWMITPDAAASALGVLSAYSFWKWLRQPTWARACTAGLTLGLVELTKLTWIVLFGLWPFLWLLYRLGRSRGNDSLPHICTDVSQLAAVLVLGLYVLNLGYGFEGSFQRLNDYVFVSRTFAADDSLTDKAGGGNRFAGTWLGALRLPVPENYVSGLDLQKLDFERGKWSYLHGEWKHGGWWYYYLYALVWKLPLGTWLLGLLTIGLTLGNCRMWSADWRDELIVLMPGIAVFVLVSAETGFSQYLRYVLPSFPFAFIWIGKVGRSLPLRRVCVAPIVVAAFLWSTGASLWIYPHSLSYFNELAGGPTQGYKYLLGANVDWGQDLWRLKEWYDEHPEARPLRTDLITFVDLDHFGIESEEPGPFYNDTAHRWYAISVDRLHDRDKRFEPILSELQPIQHIGFSILIYQVESNALSQPRIRVRRSTTHSRWQTSQPMAPDNPAVTEH